MGRLAVYEKKKYLTGHQYIFKLNMCVICFKIRTINGKCESKKCTINVVSLNYECLAAKFYDMFTIRNVIVCKLFGSQQFNFFLKFT